jgi:hypothetical protein
MRYLQLRMLQLSWSLRKQTYPKFSLESDWEISQRE